VARVKTKTEVATIKLTPQCRMAWESAASVEMRSLANMFEVAILDYCQRHNVEVTGDVHDVPPVPTADQKRPMKSQLQS